jgi:vitamin B12 transporter
VRRPLFSALIPFCLTAAVGVATAADSEDDGSQPVVITATRTPTPESQVASSITVITADEIAAKQSQTLPDVLKSVPGLNIVQTGGPGGQTSVFMRGTNANHVKVLVDGIDVSDPSNSSTSFDFGQFLTQDIERIEVLRGPQSGLYGSDAIGGVIDIITKSGNGPLQLTAAAQGGSFDTFNQSGGINGSTGGLHYAANIEHLHSGGVPVTPLDLLSPGEKRNNDYYDNLTGSTKLRLDVTDHFDLGFVGRYTDTHLRLTGDDFSTFPATPAAQQSATNTRQYYTRLTAHGTAFDGLIEQTLGVAYSKIESTDYTPDSDTSFFFGNRLKIDWQGNVRLATDETLVLGAEHQRDATTEPISASTIINSGYAELQSTLRDNFFNTLAVRYDDNDRFGGKVTYRVAPAYLIEETGTKLEASAGTGFKAPTLSQMFQDFADFGFFGNPNLKPESSHGYDVGFEQSLLQGTVRFGATYFKNNIRDLITNNADFTTNINVGRATTLGVESFVEYQPVQAWKSRLDYTYTEATDDILHQELLRRPRHKASLNNTWQATSQLSFEADVLFVSSWVDGNRDFSIPRLDANSYTTVDFAGNFDVTDHVSVFARVNNLFDRHYQNPDGFLQPSLGAFAGAKVKL